MAHNKDRTYTNISDVDWTNPELGDLLDKIEGLSVDQRNQFAPREVQVRIMFGWDAEPVGKPAMLVAEIDGTMVLATRAPLPHGSEVLVSGPPGDASPPRQAIVAQEREGSRAEDLTQGIYLNWLRPR